MFPTIELHIYYKHHYDVMADSRTYKITLHSINENWMLSLKVVSYVVSPETVNRALGVTRHWLAAQVTLVTTVIGLSYG